VRLAFVSADTADLASGADVVGNEIDRVRPFEIVHEAWDYQAHLGATLKHCRTWRARA